MKDFSIFHLNWLDITRNEITKGCATSSLSLVNKAVKLTVTLSVASGLAGCCDTTTGLQRSAVLTFAFPLNGCGAR